MIVEIFSTRKICFKNYIFRSFKKLLLQFSKNNFLDQAYFKKKIVKCLLISVSIIHWVKLLNFLFDVKIFVTGRHGTNHGIELNSDCMEYAYEKLEEFKQKSLALDEFDFCEPVFIQGKYN